MEEMTEGKKQALFLEMLRRLENEGKCSHRFHDLAEALFDDRLEYETVIVLNDCEVDKTKV